MIKTFANKETQKIYNQIESLSGDWKGQYSIRINDQYRICFTESDNDFYNVEIVDYH